MPFEGTTYRPPPEADALLLQVTVGCAHNRCRFCAMYRDVKFRPIPLDQIKADLIEARDIYPRAERVFLVNGDAFALEAETLITIAAMIEQVFPECRTICMYAAVRDIGSKSDRDLSALRKAGIDDLYVGIETGWEPVLARIGKGHTPAEAAHQLARLKRAGIHHIANLMLGVAGRGQGLENARFTAAFLNQTEPSLIWVGTLAIFEGTELHTEMLQGEFDPATELEILEEEKVLIQNIQLADVPFYAVHPTNTVRLSGRLPRDGEKMIATIDRQIQHMGEDALETCLARTSL